MHPISLKSFVYAVCRRTVPPVLGLKSRFDAALDAAQRAARCGLELAAYAAPEGLN
jgi:hypothetical protein